jgi:tRNA (guanine-N7-)-methyltransferase
MAKVVEPTGFWHLATDWAEYAESMQATFALNENWEGGVFERPSWRPVTHFEKRAIREDRPIVDMWFTRI